MTPPVFIIDTNVLVAGLISSQPDSPTVRIMDAMLDATILYLLSPSLLREYRLVMLRPKLVKLHQLAEDEIDQILAELTANAIWREPLAAGQAPDTGDNHLWDLLLQDKETVLITGDQRLLDNPPAGRSVMSPASYLEAFAR